MSFLLLPQPWTITTVGAAAAPELGEAWPPEDVLIGQPSRDDPLYDEEVVEAFLCPTGDLRHYFELEVSPLNVPEVHATGRLLW